MVRLEAAWRTLREYMMNVGQTDEDMSNSAGKVRYHLQLSDGHRVEENLGQSRFQQ